MRIIKSFLLVLILIISCATVSYANTVYHGETETYHISEQKVRKTGWERNSGGFYYRKNGKLLKNCLIKIGKNVYGFDEEGCSIRSKSARFKKRYYDFDRQGHAVIVRIPVKKKNKNIIFHCFKVSSGRYMYSYEDIKLVCEDKAYSSKSCRTWIGYNIHEKAWKSAVVFTKKNAFYECGERFSVNDVRKGMTVRFFYKGAVTDSIPRVYENIVKIVVPDKYLKSIPE